jgi:capsular polysaccharide biosynthesis protein
MDLLALFSTVRRHRLIVALVLLFAVAGEAFVLFGIPPQYESKVQYVLINPPAAPTDTEIARDPSLGKLNTNNPYLRLPNPSVVTDVLAQRVSGEGVRRALRAKGADATYLIAPTNAIGSGLVIEITGTGTSVQQASRTIDLVTERMTSELRGMQVVDGANDRFLIKALPVSPPTDPVRKVTSTVRSLIAVAVAAIVVLFGLVSVAEAIPPRRTKRVSPSDGPAYDRPAGRHGPANDRPARLHDDATIAMRSSATPRRDGSAESDITILLPRMHPGESHEAMAAHPSTRSVK